MDGWMHFQIHKDLIVLENGGRNVEKSQNSTQFTLHHKIKILSDSTNTFSAWCEPLQQDLSNPVTKSYYFVTFRGISSPTHLNQLADFPDQHVTQLCINKPLVWFRCVGKLCQENNMATFTLQALMFNSNYLWNLIIFEWLFTFPNTCDYVMWRHGLLLCKEQAILDVFWLHRKCNTVTCSERIGQSV